MFSMTDKLLVYQGLYLFCCSTHVFITPFKEKPTPFSFKMTKLHFFIKKATAIPLYFTGKPLWVSWYVIMSFHLCESLCYLLSVYKSFLPNTQLWINERWAFSPCNLLEMLPVDSVSVSPSVSFTPPGLYSHTSGRNALYIVPSNSYLLPHIAFTLQK